METSRHGVTFDLHDEPEAELPFSLPVTYLSYHAHLGYPAEAQSNSADVEPMIRACLGPPLDAPLPSSAPTLRLTIFVHDEAAPPSRPPITRIHDDKMLIVAGASFGVADGRTGHATLYMAPEDIAKPHLFGRVLAERLLLYGVLRRRDLYAFHAAAVGLGERALLLHATKGTGKSTLAYAALREGLTFISDDLVARHLGDSSRRVWGHPHLLYLDPQQFPLYPELASLFNGPPAPDHKMQLELGKLFPGRLCSEAALMASLLLVRGEGRESHLEPISPDAVLAMIGGDIRFGRHEEADAALLAQIEQDATSLLVSLPTYRLYVGSDLKQAVTLMRRVLEEG